MKIAMPYLNGMVNPHFGHSKEFAVFDSEGGKITGKKIVKNEGLDHNHEGLAGLLKSEGVEAIITGGIGRPMMNALQSIGFKVTIGASGEAEKVAEDFLNGTLVTSPVTICGCGDHHGHGHGH